MGCRLNLIFAKSKFKSLEINGSFIITRQKCKVKVEKILVGSNEFEICSLLDRQQFFDPENEALLKGISSSFWPLFGQIWPMSKVLAQIMLEEQLEGRSVLEVGCGIALPSIVVKHLGGDITFGQQPEIAVLKVDGCTRAISKFTPHSAKGKGRQPPPPDELHCLTGNRNQCAVPAISPAPIT